MENRPRVLPNKRKYWESRRGLSPHSNSQTSEDTQERGNAPDVTIDQLNAAVTGLKQCIYCKNSDASSLRQVVVDKHDSLIFTECLKCHALIGQDDLASPDDARAWLQSLPVDMCNCGNTDPFKFIFGERDGKAFFTCKGCKSEIPMGKHDDAAVRDSEEDACQLQCECGNGNGELFSVFSVNDTILAIQCLVCDMYAYTQCLNDFPEVDDVPPQAPVSMQEAKQAYISGRARVKDASQLHEADHIAWWRPEQYWHHALVKDISPDTDQVTVIHYNGPSPSGHKVKGKVVEEKLKLKEQSGIMYRMIYNGPCLPPDVAIVRATTRLTESTYNFFTNNCEHFVRWCKTGTSICEQVNNAVKAAGNFGKNMGGYFSGKLLRQALTKLAEKAVLGSGLAAPVGSVATDAAATTARHMCKVGAAVVIGLEVGTAVWDIHKAHQQRASGDISRREFVNVVVRRSSQCVLRGSGTIIGGYVGSVLIPVPVVGTLVGSSLGALLGHYAGSGLGYLVAKRD